MSEEVVTYFFIITIILSIIAKMAWDAYCSYEGV